MKKIASIVAIAFVGVIVLPSCKKDYTCTCTVGGVSSTPIKYDKVSKKDAQAACDIANAAMATSGGSCKLN